VKRKVALSIDQLYRAQPGGIGTYIRGLVSGFAELASSDVELAGLGPRGARPEAVNQLGIEVLSSPLPSALLSRVWSLWPLGVPRDANVVHATSMAGPFAGGASNALHSTMIHDLLWRDVPTLTTTSGAEFHEARLQLLLRRKDVRIFVTSQSLKNRLLTEGFSADRLRVAPLGVDDDTVEPASPEELRDLLHGVGVTGPFTLHCGTREPRKNIERLIKAHSMALQSAPELGPLVLVGPQGWGDVDTSGAVVLGAVARPVVKALYRDATVVAFVPIAEGWGLPAVEALHAGARVVVSSTTPSVEGNSSVVLVNPFEVEDIARGLCDALQLGTSEEDRTQRRLSVSSLTWQACAVAHSEGWK
jgi:glycosyltransferase involved in cell wall biosynthesis